MASSGSYDFTLTRDNIIDLAHQHIGAVGEGESASANQVTEASRLLNMLVKFRMKDGMPAWVLKRGYVLPVSGQSSINTDSHVVMDYDRTTISSTAASGATSIEVASITGVAASDQIGVELTSGDMHWTTVNGAPSGSTITLTSALTGAAASTGQVFAYTASTNRVQKPVRIVDANILDVTDDSSWKIRVVSESEYYGLGNRTAEGTPNLMFYTIRPSTDTALETNGQIFFYPRFEDGERIIEFTYQRPFGDFDGASDNPDFPQEFYLPLMLELAALLGPKFGVDMMERAQLFKEAKLYFEEALETIYPEGSMFIQPSFDGR